MLTDKQEAIFNFIKSHWEEHLESPTQKTIQDSLKIKSDSFLNYCLDRLEDTGHILRNPNKARKNIELAASPFTLPLIGKISAGQPIEAIENYEHIDVTKQLLGEGRFLLQVKGDSMIEDHICDGDWVLCESCQTAPNGTIVVALVDGDHATLKRFYRKDNKIRLQPSNPNYPVQVYEEQFVTIQGIFLGIIRLAK